MENTGKILFRAHPEAEWFVASGNQSLGPMSALEVYERILAGELSWVHFAWREGQGEWKRISEIALFQKAMPQAPKKAPAPPPPSRSKKSPPPIPIQAQEAPKEWYLHYNDAQFGPFSTGEVENYLRMGKLHGRVFAWKDGLGDWAKLEDLSEFKAGVKAAGSAREVKRSDTLKAQVKAARPVAVESRERRVSPRIPLVARLMVAGKNQLSVALCRDISVGGMQVLTDHPPGEVGAKLKLNVSPTGKSKGLKAFVAEGEVVRILEDGRGYSFRFISISDAARTAIEKYIESTRE